jgi:selenocysteine-specific elongation factor
VTGTLNSGEIAEGDELVLLPDGIKVRVRGVQSHGQSQDRVGPGRRTAVNLAGVDHEEIARGMVLTARDVVRPTQLLDCELEMLRSAPRSLRSRQRVRAHLGAAEVLARVQVLNEDAEIKPGERDLVQLRLESPVAALPTQRLVIRSYSPQLTIGGGTILDIAPPKHRRRDVAATRDFLTNVASTAGDDVAWLRVLIEGSALHGMSLADLRSRIGLTDARLTTALEALVDDSSIKEGGGCYVSTEIFARIEDTLIGALEAFHKAEPLAGGLSREALLAKLRGVPAELSAAVVVGLTVGGRVTQGPDGFALASHSTQLTPEEQDCLDRLSRIFADAKLEVPRVDEALTSAASGNRVSTADARKLLQLLVTKGEIVKVTNEFYFSRAVIDEMTSRLRDHADSTSDRLIDVSKFKELTGVSRKYAIPLLEYLDAERITRRLGDKRVVI